ncbi:MAG: TIGR02996 domain-containing protein [Kofleriaceae bacterium]
MKRNLELEAAIIAAPDDPDPRMVYGDWLQAEGDPRGEWAALRTRLEATPTDHTIRVAAIDFITDRRKQLFGAGAPALVHAYLGWKGGFVDELRLQPWEAGQDDSALPALFEHPTMRFVRHIALGALAPNVDAALDAIIDAELPLLEELVVHDALDVTTRKLDAIAELPLTKLSLSHAYVTKPMPTLRELVVVVDDATPHTFEWLTRGGAPALEWLQLWHRTTGHPSLQGVRASLPKLVVEIVHAPAFDPASITARSPLIDRAKLGRERLRQIPGAGRIVSDLAWEYIDPGKDQKLALALLDVAATLPFGRNTWYHGRAALAQERAGLLDEAELRAREALVWSPDPWYWSIVIDTQRRQKRFADAYASFPKAFHAMENPPKHGLYEGPKACLLDCMLAYVQDKRPDDALALFDRFPDLVDGRNHALASIIHMHRGDREKAEEAFAKVADGEGDNRIRTHARAVMAAYTGDEEGARTAIQECKDMVYNDMAWLRTDPKLRPYLRKKRKRKPKAEP